MIEETTAETASVISQSLVDGVALYECVPAQDAGLPPMVLVHGGMFGAWMWEPFQLALAARGVSSIAVDLLSHGGSRVLPEQEWGARSLTESAYEVGVACAVAAERGLAPVLLGWSMGGLAALAHAARVGDQLAGLVLLAPVVPSAVGAEPLQLQLPPLEGPTLPPFPIDVARRLFFDAVDDDTAAALTSRLQPESVQAVRESVTWSAQVDLAAVTVRTLLVAGHDDPLVPVAALRALERLLRCDHVEIATAGHGLPLDPGWTAVLDLVLAWVRVGADR